MQDVKNHSHIEMIPLGLCKPYIIRINSIYDAAYHGQSYMTCIQS